MNHRIFLAIKISDAIRSEIREFRNSFTEMQIRWSLPDNLHVTIIPPWYSENLQSDIQILSSIQSLPHAFILEFTEIMFGPDPRKPRLLWVHGKETPELSGLKSMFEKSLQQKIKYKNFRPHITLGRFKSRIEPDIRKQFPYNVSWSMQVTHLTLLESFLSPRGARYETIADFSLPGNNKEYT